MLTFVVSYPQKPRQRRGRKGDFAAVMTKEQKPRVALWLGAALLCGAALLWLLLPRSTQGHIIATITVGEETVRTLDLTTAPDQEFSILDETGLEITFQVQDHAIRFLSSDCPDKVCVNTGFLREDLQVATCLPNRTTLFLSVSQE